MKQQSLHFSTYTLSLLIGHDLLDIDGDIFVRSRAYRGKLVAVVSAVRYNPSLGKLQDVERKHAWPASHCESFINSDVGNHSGARILLYFWILAKLQQKDALATSRPLSGARRPSRPLGF